MQARQQRRRRWREKKCKTIRTELHLIMARTNDVWVCYSIVYKANFQVEMCVCICIYNRQKVMGFSLSSHLFCTIFISPLLVISVRFCLLNFGARKHTQTCALNNNCIDENVRFTFTEKRRHHRRHCDSASSSNHWMVVSAAILHTHRWIWTAEWIWCGMVLHSFLHSDSAMHSTVICHIETKLAASPTKWFVWCLNNLTI